MGCFGYICPVCKTSIRGDCMSGGERCILIHKRHGVEIGRTEGHYAEYGDVIEDTQFRSTEIEGPNSHEEICRSEMNLSDSYEFGYKRIAPNGNVYNISIVDQMVHAFLDNHTLEELRNIHGLQALLKQATHEMRTGISKGLYPFNVASEEEGIKYSLEWLLINTFEHCSGDTAFKHCRIKLVTWCRTLPQWQGVASGTLAVHSKCFNSLAIAQQNELTLSEHDPKQSSGNVRKKYQ